MENKEPINSKILDQVCLKLGTTEQDIWKFMIDKLKKNVSEIIPVGETICIIPTPKEKMDGKIIIPDSAVDLPVTGIAIACGPLKKQVLEGDLTVYPQNYGTPYNIQGVDYIFIWETRLLTIIR